MNLVTPVGFETTASEVITEANIQAAFRLWEQADREGWIVADSLRDEVRSLLAKFDAQEGGR